MNLSRGRMAERKTRALRGFLLVLTGRPATPDAEPTAESTRQLAAIVMAWLAVAIVMSGAVVFALHLQQRGPARQPAAMPGPRSPAEQMRR